VIAAPFIVTVSAVPYDSFVRITSSARYVCYPPFNCAKNAAVNVVATLDWSSGCDGNVTMRSPQSQALGAIVGV